MIRGLIQALRVRSQLHRLTESRRMAIAWDHTSRASLKRIERYTKRMSGLQQELQDLAYDVKVELAEAGNSQLKQKVVVEALQNEIKVLSDILVPSLTAANIVLLKRWEAELAVHAKIQASTTEDRER